MTDKIVVLVTCASRKEALKIKDALLEGRDAACVNVLPGVESFFRWKKKIDTCREVLLLIKTKRALLSRVERRVKKIHSYEVPEIIALPITGGSRDYLKWIEGNVKNNV